MARPPSTCGDEKVDGSRRRNSFAREESSIKQEDADVAVASVDEEKGALGTEATAPVAEPKPISLFQLFRYSTRFELFLNFIGILAAAVAGAAQPLMTLLFGNLTQDFVAFSQTLAAGSDDISTAAANFRHASAKNATYLVYIGIGIFVCTYAYMFIWVYTSEVNAKRIRERYLQSILRQDIAFFDNVGAGEVATRIQTDTHLVQQGMSEKIALVVNFLGAFFCGFILAYVRCWRLALAMTSIFPCIAMFGMIMNKFVVAYKQLSLKHTAEAGSLAEEVISTVRTAQAFGTQKALAALYDDYIEKSLKVEMKAAFASGIGLGSLFFVVYSAYALAFSFGTTLINSGNANAGQVINVFFAILIGSFSLALLAPEAQAITTGLSAAAKLYDTIDRVPPIDSANPGGLKPENIAGEIVLENVKFSYPSRPTVEVVKDLSISFRAGKTAALVGASGSGKSTVISLVERFYDPTAGSVKLDGYDLKDLNVKWLRSQIGLVSQEPTLFATTVKENVAHGLIGTGYENASQEEKEVLIKEACIKANADGFIMQLPLGYDTLVGERGLLLSGGQKQRVAIARAIVSDPRILLLDEATSALDTQSEGVVQDALDKASAGRTTITIAHRLSTIKDADVIYVMGGGVVLEHGTHQDLLQKGGAYARLVDAQRLREGQGTDTNATSEDLKEDIKEQLAREVVPLDRKSTNHSLASEILRQKRSAAEEFARKEDDYSILYLFRRMLPMVRNQWRNYFLGTIFSIATGMIYPAFGIVFAKGIDGFSLLEKAERRKAGDRNALWLFIIAIIATLSLGLQNYVFSSAAAHLSSRLRHLAFKSMLRQDIVFFDKEENSTGSLVAKLSDNPQKFEGLAGVTLGAIIQGISTVITGSILGLIFVWRIGLVGMACMPLLISIGYIRLVIIVACCCLKDQTNKKAHEDSAQLACEAAGSIRTVAALTREDDCLRIYSQSLEEPLRNSNRTAIWSNMLYAFSQSLSFFVIALVFWYGAILVSNRKASTFGFFIGLISTTFGAVQAGNAFQFVPDISSAKGAGSDIIKLLDSTPEIDAESSEGKVISESKIEGHIRFENVHFRYPTRSGVRVLRDLSFEVEPGTYVALVGASGSGKSTTIQLVERFYDPLAGNIYLDGENITELNVQEYRKHLALVSQEPTLYAGTIRFNILLGATKPHSEITQKEIESACRDANILDFIQSLPQGFDTEVGGKGSQLSGGQKTCNTWPVERIAISRALLRNPKVLLLDEATSALDSNSEKVVQEALDQAAKGRTTIAIAHRLSTIQNADRIYFMKDGRVSESGTHDQLLQLRGGYYEYVQLQALSKN
ncbi:multidrug resistance protein 1 [Gymnopilus junonius]|uniref:Multidrug resistance protein 1 n=1 Tax=Gymnopilus junonius TaxID=109634 RepID=A0A9P5TKH9_GYMJU|nr:multidrug resistance protein 1 [Gymnopilus junonius]